MNKSGFSIWVREQIDARSYTSNEEAARASTVSVGNSPVDVNGVSSVVPGGVAACGDFDVPIQEVLIASGYMTEEESRPMDAVAMSLRRLSTDQILDGLRRRASPDSGGSPIPVRVDGVIHQH